MKVSQLDHVALHVADVAQSCTFYQSVLQLTPIPRPAFDFPGAWFRLGGHQELHLIGDRVTPTSGAASRGNHWALLIDDMDAMEAFLQSIDAPYTPRRTRPDGAYQIYVTDPDGHVCELCTAPSATTVQT